MRLGSGPGSHLAEVQQLVAEHAQELPELDLAGVVHIVLGHDLHQLLVREGVPQVLEQLRYLRGSDLACRRVLVGTCPAFSRRLRCWGMTWLVAQLPAAPEGGISRYPASPDRIQWLLLRCSTLACALQV